MKRTRKAATGIVYRIGEVVRIRPQRHGRRRFIIGLIIITLAIVITVRIIATPAHGHQTAVDQKLQSKRTVAAPPPASNVQTNYFHLDLPIGYKQQPSGPVPGLLYQQTIIKPSALGSLVINIGIGTLDGSLANDSSYRLRQQQTDRYTLTTKTIRGETVTIANDTQSAAVVAFWPHDGKLATIGITTGVSNSGGGDNSEQNAALQTLLNAWQWQ